MPCRADGLGTGLGPMTDEDYRKMERESSGNSYRNNITINKNKLQELEEDLCTVRDLLFRLINDRKLPDNVQDILSDQLIKHKSHRKDDFEYIKQEINKRYDKTKTFLNMVEKYFKRKYNTEEEFYEKYNINYKALEKYTKDKEIIDSMNFEEFWQDRYLFEEYKKKC